MYLVILALAFQAPQPQPQPQPQPLTEPEGVRWEEIAVEPASASYIDPASLRRTGGGVRFLGRNVARVGNAGAMLVDMEIDCGTAAFVLHAVTLQMRTGGAMQSVAVAPEAIDVERGLNPASEADQRLFRRLCGRDLPTSAAGSTQ